MGMAILMGFKRGIFSNEAGEGSAPNAAATADVSHPVKQGLIQTLGVFTDTLIVCTCTAFIILSSGLYDCGANGIELTQAAMTWHIGPAGNTSLPFAYSSLPFQASSAIIITENAILLSCAMALHTQRQPSNCTGLVSEYSYSSVH